MEQSALIAAAGVFILLLAFFLNILQAIRQNSVIYLAMNLTGAALACYASVLIDFIPFVILEAVWAIVALVALLKRAITER